MGLREFHNGLRILLNIDGFDLAEAGIEFADQAAMDAFHRDPFRFFIRADDATAEKLWALMQRRMKS